MKIKIKKGVVDVYPILTHIQEDIREKLRPLRYSEKLKHYVDELQKGVTIEWYVKIKRKETKPKRR